MKIRAISNASFPTSPAQPRQIVSDGLRIGQTLMSDVVSQDGKKIVKAGTRVTPDLLNKLKDSVLGGNIKKPILAAG